ncbi:hypothetical protein [Citreimonas salinaria]|uniref:EF-hand domain-containing protein n=1 Tax=Citreimonas salinaria TaxID=321339 RepID=A0A1H3LKD9_9RHOB|nr:hypothetical protein [Citreimonas salinaria]SDY64912.1 hypothetical protein SAMN05444340_11367 [Citreimonas salinaria]
MHKNLAGSTVILIQALSASAAMAQHSEMQEHGHAAFCDVSQAEPTPILGVADFDASGSVSEADLELLQDRVDASDYVAFFDRNADRRLDEADLELARQDIGSRSAPRDQQLALAYQHTEPFRDRETAIRKGYAPFTQTLHGHGAHWSQHPEGGGLGYSFVPGNPVGLNYASDGTLWGVFYYIGPSGSRDDGSMYPPRHAFRPFPEAPEGFEGDEDAWHWHAGTCFVGLDVNDPSLDPADYEFLERLSPRECQARAREASGGQVEQPNWVPQFHMLHVWLYELNPCGTFAGAHPELDVNAADPAQSIVHPERHPEAPHPDFDFEGGTMCAWLSETGTTPEYCAQGAVQ